MADILILKDGGRVKYAVGDGGFISVLRDISVIEYADGSTEIAGDMNRTNAEVVEGVTLPENFTGDKFDYIGGEFFAVPEPESEGEA